jgi:hypothetical protein
MAAISMVAAMGATAMAAPPPGSTNHSEIALYGWTTGINADLAIDGIETSVDASFSDILHNLDNGVIAYYETRNGNTGFYVNYVYARVGDTEQRPLLEVDWQVKQSIVEAGVLLRKGNPQRPVDVIVGLRYVDLDTDLRLTPGGSGSAGDSWVDPVIGARYTIPLSDKWNFAARGDIGGLIFGADFSWSLSGLFRYRLSPQWDLGVGYRHLYLDRDNAEFGFDGNMSGALVGFAYIF